MDLLFNYLSGIEIRIAIVLPNVIHTILAAEVWADKVSVSHTVRKARTKFRQYIVNLPEMDASVHSMQAVLMDPLNTGSSKKSKSLLMFSIFNIVFGVLSCGLMVN